jgi:hypothetical protein
MECSQAENLSYTYVAATWVHVVHPVLLGPGKGFSCVGRTS